MKSKILLLTTFAAMFSLPVFAQQDAMQGTTSSAPAQKPADTMSSDSMSHGNVAHGNMSKSAADKKAAKKQKKAEKAAMKNDSMNHGSMGQDSMQATPAKHQRRGTPSVMR